VQWRRYFDPALLCVSDKYTASGTVYTAANTGRSLSWYQQADLGLPKLNCFSRYPNNSKNCVVTGERKGLNMTNFNSVSMSIMKN